MNHKHLKNFSAEFFASLGYYVYGYIDPNAPKKENILYGGNGQNNRGAQHIDEKGFNLDHLYIYARNCERFAPANATKAEKNMVGKAVVEALESDRISRKGLNKPDNPAYNKLAGKHAECFVRQNANIIHEEYLKSIRDFRAECDILLNEMDKRNISYNFSGHRPNTMYYVTTPEINKILFKISEDRNKITISVGGKFGGTPEWKKAYAEKLMAKGFTPDTESSISFVSYTVDNTKIALDLMEEFLN